MDDWATSHTDLLRAVEGIAPGTRLLALLTHVPDVADHVPPGWFPLILAGHNHGVRPRAGLLARLPWRLARPVVPPTRYPRGFYDVNGALLYVSRGVGMSGFPVRAGSIPEVTVMELTGGRGLPDGPRYARVGG